MRIQPRVTNVAVTSGTWLVLSAAVLWGTTGTAQALAPAGAAPSAVAAMRLVVGGGVLALVAVLRGTLRLTDLRNVRTLVSGAAIALYQVTFFSGLARTGVAVGTFIAIGSAPFIAGMLELLLFQRRQSRVWWAATCAAVIGCGLLLSGDGSWNVDLLGALLALTAGGSFAVYAVVSKQLLGTLSADAAVGAVFCVGGVLLVPLLLVSDITWAVDPRGLAVAIHLGLVATAVAHGLYMRGLAAVSAAAGATLTLAEPLTAGLLSVVVLKERVSSLAYVGAALLLAALAALTRDRNQ